MSFTRSSNAAVSRSCLLTHRDDVADAERYAKHFGARIFIHEADRSAASYATDLIRGRAPTTLGDDLLAIPVPGHTKGSVAFLFEDRCLFAGDSLSWDFTTNDLRASKHCLLVFLARADEIVAHARRASLRVDIRGAWREFSSTTRRDASTIARADRANGRTISDVFAMHGGIFAVSTVTEEKRIFITES